MRINFIILISIFLNFLTHSPVIGGQWQVGGALSGYNKAGTVNSEGSFVETEARLGIRADNGNMMRLTVSNASVILASGGELIINTLRVDRCSKLNIYSRQFLLSIGLGISRLTQMQENDLDVSGALNYAVSLEYAIVDRSTFTLLGGILFTGAPVPHTETFSDRVGISLSIMNSIN